MNVMFSRSFKKVPKVTSKCFFDTFTTSFTKELKNFPSCTFPIRKSTRIQNEFAPIQNAKTSIRPHRGHNAHKPNRRLGTNLVTENS